MISSGMETVVSRSVAECLRRGLANMAVAYVVAGILGGSLSLLMAMLSGQHELSTLAFYPAGGVCATLGLLLIVILRDSQRDGFSDIA
jgi:hypothetical protein